MRRPGTSIITDTEGHPDTVSPAGRIPKDILTLFLPQVIADLTDIYRLKLFSYSDILVFKWRYLQAEPCCFQPQIRYSRAFVLCPRVIIKIWMIIEHNMSLLILYVSIALVFSFFCSIAEAVLLSVTSPYVASLEQKKKRSGELLRKLKDNVNRPLTAILTLNTFANTFGAAGAGAQAAKIFGSEVVGIASAILTLSILIFSEIIPKTLGATYWRQLAPVIAIPLRYLVLVLYPFVFMSQILTKNLSHSPTLKGFSREEFAAMADLGAQEGQLAVKESRILKNLFRLRSSTIKNIMTPRTVVLAIQKNMSIAEFFTQHYQTPFSRIPIYNKDRDDITGFVLKDDILLAQAKDMHDSQLKEFRREIKAVPSTNSVSELFEFLLDNREHIVLVVDEYGGMEGIVTLEDVVETLLGLEIVDEADKTVDMQALARALWEKRARRIGLITDETPPSLSDHDAVKPFAEDATESSLLETEASDHGKTADADSLNAEAAESATTLSISDTKNTP